jgi:hypothetical protein
MGDRVRKWAPLPGLPKPGILAPVPTRHQRDSLRISVIAALLVAAIAGAGLGAYYLWLGTELETIGAELVSEDALAKPDDPDTAQAIAQAPAQCARVYDFRANPVARRLRASELGALWERCQKIADIASGLAKIGRAPAQ